MFVKYSSSNLIVFEWSIHVRLIKKNSDRSEKHLCSQSQFIIQQKTKKKMNWFRVFDFILAIECAKSKKSNRWTIIRCYYYYYYLYARIESCICIHNSIFQSVVENYSGSSKSCTHNFEAFIWGAVKKAMHIAMETAWPISSENAFELRNRNRFFSSVFSSFFF